MTPDDVPDGATRVLSEELVAAASSPGGGLNVIQRSLQGPHWKEPIDLQIQLQVGRDAGGSIAVLITEPYEGPKAPDTIFRIDPSDPMTMEAMVVELRRMFAAWHADRESPWRFEQHRSGAQGPVDEDWQAHPTASDLLDRLRRVRSGRGGVVAVAAIDRPLTVMRLSVSGRVANMLVTGRTEPLLERWPSNERSPDRWSVRGSKSALKLLRDLSAALGEVTHPDDPAPGARLALRLETNASSKRASEAGCVPLVMVALLTVVVGWVLYYLGWPQTGIYAHLARQVREGETNDPQGGALIVTIALAIGVVLALLAMKGVERMVDRFGLRYTLEGPVLKAAALGVYGVWVAALMLTPLWSLLEGPVVIIVLALVALLGVVLAQSWLEDRRRSQKQR